jgi:hypothetical protein
MSTAAIIIIVVVVVLVLIGLFILMPRMREKARIKQQERELGRRRDQAASEQREVAATHERQAEVAEQRARIAEQEAQRQRAEANLRQEKAQLHERGMADHELIEDHEREEFAGTSAVPETGADEGGARTAAPETAEAGSADGYQAGRPAAEPSRGETDSTTR